MAINITKRNVLGASIQEGELDDNIVTLAKMAGGVDGETISYDSNGDPVFVGTGTSGQVLTSNGAGQAPTMQAAGGGGDFTDRIPMVMEPAEGVISTPDLHALATQVSKITGMVLPNGASVGTLNFKCVVPDQLASVPAASIKFYIMTQAALTDKDLRLVVKTRAHADTENIDQAFSDETEVTVRMPNTTETLDIYDQDMGIDPVAGDILTVQIIRDPADALDNFTDDVIIIAAYLEIDRSTT